MSCRGQAFLKSRDLSGESIFYKGRSLIIMRVCLVERLELSTPV